jgi:hypothetical protein
METSMSRLTAWPWFRHSRIIAKFFMEHFEETALEGVTYKPLCWFCYVDDTFIIWTYGPGKLS